MFVFSKLVKVVSIRVHGEHVITQDALSRPIELETRAIIDRVPRKLGSITDLTKAMQTLLDPTAFNVFSAWLDNLYE